jgi:hypothetical protein
MPCELICECRLLFSHCQTGAHALWLRQYECQHTFFDTVSYPTDENNHNRPPAYLGDLPMDFPPPLC